MCYVDLNPAQAGIAQRLEDCEHTSLVLRLQGGTNTAAPLRPLASDLTDDGKPAPRMAISFGDYANRTGVLPTEHLEGLHGDGFVKPGSRPTPAAPATR